MTDTQRFTCIGRGHGAPVHPATKEEWEKIRSLGAGARVRYFWDYYKFVLVIGFFVPMIIGVLITETVHLKGFFRMAVYFPNIIMTDFLVADSETFKIGQGNIIQGGCSVSCDVEFGDFNVFNGGVVFGHDAKVGSFNTFMP